MPLAVRSYTKQTAWEALRWLKRQKEDWAKDIHDVDVAVQLYLNFKNREQARKKEFSKELQKLCVNDPVSLVTQDKEEKPDSSSPLVLNTDSSPSLSDTPSQSSLPSTVSLDEKTQELLAKTAARLNLNDEKDALNILIQFGFASLQTLLKDI